MRLFKKLFSFFWDRSLLIFLIIGGAEHTRQHGRQPAFVRRAGLLGRDRADVHRMQRVQLYLQPEIQF